MNPNIIPELLAVLYRSGYELTDSEKADIIADFQAALDALSMGRAIAAAAAGGEK